MFERGSPKGGYIFVFIVALCLFLSVTSLGRAQTESTAYLIDTIAGSDLPLDADRAVDTWLNFPVGVATDDAGNVYVSDTFNHRVLRIKPDGTRETAAGSGTCGSPVDGGPATEARLCTPWGLTFGPDGSLYIADPGNERIHQVSPKGTITTVAGSGEHGFSGDGGPATGASFSFPFAVAVDPMGNLYIADTFNERVRKVDVQGMISTFAGSGDFGFAGDGGPATAARLRSPQGLAVGPAGKIYIADSSNHRIRVVDTHGNINTFAGGGTSRDNGPPTDYRLSHPIGVAVDAAGVVYIANQFGDEILRSTADFIEKIVGAGTRGFAGDGGPALEALLNGPQGVALSAAGGETTIYFVDSENHRVRAVTDGTIHTVAGTSHLSGDGGPATEALLDGPSDVALDASGNLYIADERNHAVRRVAIDGTITTVAGTGIRGRTAPGSAATETKLLSPQGVLVTRGGDLLIADSSNDRVLRVDEGGVAQSFAGTGFLGFEGDGGPATEARLLGPVGLAEDNEGSVYIADQFNQRIRRVGPDSIINTVAGNGESGFSGDAGAATDAALNIPTHVAVDDQGNILITDTFNQRVRLVTPGGLMDTVAGGGETRVDLEDVPALEANIGLPWGLVIDNTDGNGKGVDGRADVFISSICLVYRLGNEGTIRTIAGGSCRFEGDGGSALDAGFGPNSPRGMAIDADGNIYVADLDNNRVRKLTPVVTRVSTGGVVNAAAIAFSVAVDTVAPETIVSIFGIGLSIADGDALSLPLPTRLAGVTVEVSDSQGVSRPASLFAVRSTQINCLIPAGTALGPATLTVTNSLGSTSTIDIQVVAVTPGLFAINASGQGLAAATAFRRSADLVDTPLQVFNPAGFPFEAVPLDLGSETDLVVLSLFGTGIRGFQNSIVVTIGGEAAQVLGFAPSGQFEGLDQLNVLIPRSLIGRAVVEILVTVDGQMLNPVTITIL